jgi:hypothetical protein
MTTAKKSKKTYCPDCKDDCVCDGKKLKQLGEPLKTDWYGKLTYYKCSCCKTKFVSQDGDELETAAIC